MTDYPPMNRVLPHRAPMILLDCIDADSDESIACRVTIRPDSPFIEQGIVPAVVATEYMAQCVAAFAGLKALRSKGAVRTGYLIAAREIEFAVDGFRVGEELLVKAHRVWGEDILGRFECSIDSGGSRTAFAVLTVYQGEIEAMDAGRSSKS